MIPRWSDGPSDFPFEVDELGFRREMELLRDGSDLVVGFLDNLIRLREVAVLNRMWEAS